MPSPRKLTVGNNEKNPEPGKAGISIEQPLRFFCSLPLPVASRGYLRFALGSPWHRLDATALWGRQARKRSLTLTRCTNRGVIAGWVGQDANRRGMGPCATHVRFCRGFGRRAHVDMPDEHGAIPGVRRVGKGINSSRKRGSRLAANCERLAQFSSLNPVRTGVASFPNRRTHSGMQREFQFEAMRSLLFESAAGLPALNIRLETLV